MTVREEDLNRAGPWPAGINNLASEGALPTDENGRPIALREADNVDLDRDGFASRREGYTSRYSGTLIHSFWSDDALDFGLFVDDGELHAFHADETVQPLGLMLGNLPASYALVGDRVFVSNAHGGHMVTLDLQVQGWAPEHPPGQPQVAVFPGFGLHPGVYQVAVTFTDELGRESGTGRAATIRVPEGHGIQLTGIPVPASAPTVNVYLSDADDNVLRRHCSLMAGTTTLIIGTQAQGVKLATQLLDPMPGGQITRIFNGRHWVADGRFLRWSPPLRYGMTDLGFNLARFDAPIDLLEPIDGGKQEAGIYVAAGKRTYWLPGADPAAFNLIDAHSAGAVPGTSTKVPGQSLGLADDGDYTVWLSRKGVYCIGMPSGAITVMKSSQAVVDDAVRGASLFAERDGARRIVTTLRGPRPQGLAVTDRAVAHVIHVDR